MENKNVGWLILGISAVVIIMVFLFNQAMLNIVNNCPTVQLGYECPAHGTVKQQTYLSLAIVGILIIIGLMLIFSKPKEKIVFKKIKENDKNEKKNIDISQLTSEEKAVLKLIQENKAIFQADLIEKLGFPKAKVTRILDRLEGQGIVERKRRGMTNVVVLKD